MEYYSAIKKNLFESFLMKWITRAYSTEWSKSEREKQMVYTNTYIWNLERQYWWNYFQGSNGDTDIENRFMNMEWSGDEREGGTYGESNMETYTITREIDSQ